MLDSEDPTQNTPAAANNACTRENGFVIFPTGRNKLQNLSLFYFWLLILTWRLRLVRLESRGPLSNLTTLKSLAQNECDDEDGPDLDPH